MSDLTLEQQATNFGTITHIERVRHHINSVIHALIRRGEDHDKSKLHPPEVQLFTEFTPLLAGSDYDSEEYKGFLSAMKPALDHHYGRNRHHPEHFKGGVDDMNIVDLIEMVCDWKAAGERQDNGNLRKSLEINANRFNLSPQLVKILENSIDIFEK